MFRIFLASAFGLCAVSPAQAGEVFGGIFLHDVETPLTASGVEGGMDLQLGYRWEQLRIYGSVNNLFDSGRAVAIFSGATSAEDSATILTPRSYWLGAQWSW